MSSPATVGPIAAVLGQLVAATEAVLEDCVRGEADVEQIAAIVHARGEGFTQLAASPAPTSHERELARRLCALDERLLAWCDRRRRELADALASTPRRSAGTTARDEQLLSDFA